MTIVPTGALATEPPNVIPPFADVICDCRALPGQGEGEIRARIDAVLGESLRYEVEFLEPPTGGTRSSIDSPLYPVLERYLADRAPGARALPLVDAGFTDSHWVRDAWGTVAYGFAPVLHDDARRLPRRGARGRRVALARRPGRDGGVPPVRDSRAGRPSLIPLRGMGYHP